MIVMVDDEQDLLESYRFFFPLSWRVDCYFSGTQAWGALLQKQPAHPFLVITDGHMPDGDGCWLADQIRTWFPRDQVRIWLHSGDPHFRMRSPHFDRYWVKPVPPEILVESIRQWRLELGYEE